MKEGIVMSGIVGLLVVVSMIAATAFFVAVEFGVVKASPVKIKNMANEGNKKAQRALRVISNMDTYLSACQLGITMASLLLGWFGEPTVHHLLAPIFGLLNLSESTTDILSFVVAFSLVTFVHVVIGELVPKTAAINYAEKVTMNLAGPLITFYKLTKPIIWSMNALANKISGLFGMKTAGGHGETYSEEELILLMNDSYEQGEINSTEYKYVNNIFDFDKIPADEVMVPRNDMVTVDISNSNDEILKVLFKEQYSRVPVIDSDKDNIVGIIHSKEFFENYIINKEFDLKSIMHPVVYVSEATPIKKLLSRMQDEHIHIMVLADEYGGTEGIITLEDILEEIVGEIRDEFDTNEKSEIQKVNDNEIIVDGKVAIHEVNHLLDSKINEKDLDTIGGWLFMKNSELKPKEVYQTEELEFELLERTKTRYKRIKVVKTV
jgi:CBS domain containing-hemolysin-like protein